MDADNSYQCHIVEPQQDRVTCYKVSSGVIVLSRFILNPLYTSNARAKAQRYFLEADSQRCK